MMSSISWAELLSLFRYRTLAPRYRHNSWTSRACLQGTTNCVLLARLLRPASFAGSHCNDHAAVILQAPLCHSVRRGLFAASKADVEMEMEIRAKGSRPYIIVCTMNRANRQTQSNVNPVGATQYDQHRPESRTTLRVRALESREASVSNSERIGLLFLYLIPRNEIDIFEEDAFLSMK